MQNLTFTGASVIVWWDIYQVITSFNSSLLNAVILSKASVTKRRGIGPIRTEISPYKIRKKMFIFQIVRFDGICIWQNYFCILSNLGDFGAKTSLFRYLINQKRNNFIKHCPPPPCINKPPISEMCVYIRHNLYKWGLDTRGGGGNVLQQKNGGGWSAYNTWNTL